MYLILCNDYYKSRLRMDHWIVNSRSLSFRSHTYLYVFLDPTRMRKYVWNLKEREREFTIQWSILKRANSYSSGGKSCNLCLQEKLSILNADKSNLLNKRREVFSKCVHKKRFLAGKFKRRNVHDLSRTQAVNGNQRHQLGTVN